MTATCPKCGQVEVPVRQQPWQDRAYLASHNAPPNEEGFVARCGNRSPSSRGDWTPLRKPANVLPVTTTPNPIHDPSVDLWNCPCRECTRLEFEVTDTNLSLAAFRAEQFPEVYAR